MDKLDEIFEMQKGLDKYITEKRNLEFSKKEWICMRANALMVEMAEVLEEAGYKWWKKKEIDSVKLHEELVDVFHFFVGMCIDAGMSGEDLHRIYLEKNKENYDRQNGVGKKSGYDL